MVEPKRITGFMPWARDVINETPRLTAQEVYDEVERRAEDMEVRLSAALDPKQSLVCTLHKTYRDFGLERRKGRDGKYRFYPEGHPEVEDPAMRLPSRKLADPTVEELGGKPTKEVTDSSGDGCCIMLSNADLDRINALVTLGKYANEHEAHRDLVKQGLEAMVKSL